MCRADGYRYICREIIGVVISAFIKAADQECVYMARTMILAHWVLVKMDKNPLAKKKDR